MQLVYESAVHLAMEYAIRFLGGLNLSLRQEASDIISFEVTNMILETLKSGAYGSVTPKARAKYEARMFDALEQIGVTVRVKAPSDQQPEA